VYLCVYVVCIKHMVETCMRVCGVCVCVCVVWVYVSMLVPLYFYIYTYVSLRACIYVSNVHVSIFLYLLLSHLIHVPGFPKTQVNDVLLVRQIRHCKCSILQLLLLLNACRQRLACVCVCVCVCVCARARACVGENAHPVEHAHVPPKMHTPA